jgi:isochorismate synthase
MDSTIFKVDALTQEEYLDLLLLGALEGEFQFAVFKKPQETTINILIDTTDKVKKVSLQLEDLPGGFIIHPFEDQEDKKAYFLEASLLLEIDLQQEKISASELPSWVDVHKPTSEVKSRIRQILNETKTGNEGHSDFQSTSKEEFVEEVNQGIAEILNGNLSKIVPVRRKKVPLPRGFDVVRTYFLLCQAYPTAFVNFFHYPPLGTWLGASPEILIKTAGENFSTMSLAGSQKAIGDNPLKHVAWTQKEIEEQALVSRYIVNCFKKIRLREYEEIGPKTAIAGNLLHLRTDFKVNMQATGFPQLGSHMLELLHPTSAVAGMPRERALDFIHKNENFDRALFSGFIGPVNIQDETAIYVNLRCALILPEHAVLYAGAGVTEDSDPEKEWEETELKCDIIGNFIHQA